MANPAAAIGGVTSLIGARNARKAAQSQAAAMAEQAAVERENARRAAEAAKFRAVGFTSPYATPKFNVSGGKLQGVSTELSPELQARFDALNQASGQMFDPALERAMSTRRQDVADTLFGLGQQQLGAVQLEPTQAAAERTARMQEILAPGRAAQQEQLFSDLANKGLTGLAVDQGTGQQVNPYMAALAEEQAQQDRRIAAESLDLADQQIASQLQRTSGLFDAATQQELRQGAQADLALQPYQALFGAGQEIYGIGQQELARAMELSNQERDRAIAGATQQAGYMTAAGQIQKDAGMMAAQQRLARQQGLLQGLQGLNFGGMFGGGGAGTNPTTGLPNYSAAPLPTNNPFHMI